MALELFKQLTPETWDELADWCGGVKSIIDGNQAVMIIVGGVVQGTALLGDWVCQEVEGGYSVCSAQNFIQMMYESDSSFTGYEVSVDEG